MPYKSQSDSEKEYKGKTLASVYFVCQGMSSLLSWSAVLSTLDYYNTQFPDGNVYFIFPAAFSTITIIINFMMIWICKKMSINKRVTGCLVLQVTFLTILPIISNLMPQSQLGYWLVLVMLTLIGAVNQVSNSSVVGLAGYFPPKYMGRLTTGSGLGAVIPNLLRMITLLAFSDSSSQTNLREIFMYYGIAGVFLLFCATIHLGFIKSKYAKTEIRKHTQLYNSFVEVQESAIEPENLSLDDALLDGKIKDRSKNHFVKQWVTFKEIKTISIFMVLLYVQTLMLFPGVMLMKKIPDLDPAWENAILQIIFNSHDTLGKFLTLKKSLLRKEFAFGVIIFRVVFYFTFIGQIVLTTIPILNSTWFTFVNAALFGLTSGYSSSSLFILGPNSVKGEKKEIVGFILINSLCIGFLLGSFLAIPLSSIENATSAAQKYF